MSSQEGVLLPWYAHPIAGGMGGLLGMWIGHPMDTVKVLLQTQRVLTPYHGMMDAFRHVRNKGWMYFFRGVSVPLVSYGFLSALSFGTYGFVLKKLTNEQRSITYTDIFIAGSLAGLASEIPGCPVDVIRVVLQAQIPRGAAVQAGQTYHKGPVQCIREIYAHHGLRGFYRGFTMAIARDVPLNGVYFVTYEFLYTRFVSWGWAKTQRHAALMNIMAGGLAGVTFWTLAVPIDVIKSQVQAASSSRQPKSISECIKTTYKHGGVRAFYTGLSILLIRGFPVNAAMFFGYYRTLHLFTWFYDSKQTP